jgi:hypothetical protein
MATMKKPAKKMQMGGGTKPMMKKGGSFPDLNKDGKITKADILKGRGVIAKKGMKVKKAQDGYRFKNVERTSGSDKLTEFRPKINRGSGNLIPVGAKKNPVTGKPLMSLSKKTTPKNKMGGKTKKCMTGCK